MISITANDYVKDEGNSGKTVFTFTITAKNIFDHEGNGNGDSALLNLRLLDKGMDGSDGLKLIADPKAGVAMTSSLAGSISFDKNKDKFEKVEETFEDESGETITVVDYIYTKTIQVEITGDTDVEAHEMFGLAVTGGWMKRDGKITLDPGHGQGVNPDFPTGNFKVNEVAYQVVRNDDGEGKINEEAMTALGEQAAKLGLSGGKAHVEFLKGRLEFDLNGEGRKSEPKDWSELTPEEKIEEIKKLIEEIEAEEQRVLEEIDAENSKGVSEELKKRLGEIDERLDKERERLEKAERELKEQQEQEAGSSGASEKIKFDSGEQSFAFDFSSSPEPKGASEEGSTFEAFDAENVEHFEFVNGEEFHSSEVLQENLYDLQITDPDFAF
ncbi:hypothetical protein ABLO27_07450 [Roseibium sp. SCPC15]|uniref:hypothetical protein n=1 Tax=Roseibium sp. SCP15 TaxID=3141376 RepID=UPI00333D410E